MHGMKELGAATKVLGEMAKGTQSFDATAADAAMQKIRDETARIEALFEANEDDPKSEALPGIWTDFADFSVKTQALSDAASVDVGSLDDVKAVVPKIGATCSACHKVYRQK
jgi:cytochrome c556